MSGGLVHGVAQYVDGRWFSLSEEAYSSGVVLYATEAQARAADDTHHRFMAQHHMNAAAALPYVERAK